MDRRHEKVEIKIGVVRVLKPKSIRDFGNKVRVLYFDQRLSAAHYKVQIFFLHVFFCAKKLKKGENERNCCAKCSKKSFFLVCTRTLIKMAYI